MDEPSQISSVLDSRTKLSAFKDQMEQNRAKNLISNLTGYSLLPPAVNTTDNDLINTRSYFWRLRDGNTSAFSLRSTPTNNITTELEKYLMMPSEDQVDPLLWWRAQQCEYPTLSQIARDYLSIQATSVASEQAFSIAGQTISDVRNRLDGETARVILCLKSWIFRKIV